MTLYDHGYVFNRKKIFLMIACVVVIFLLAYASHFALQTEHSADSLSNIRYCHTSREKNVFSEIHLKSANSIEEIKGVSSERFLYIRGTLPNVSEHKLVLHSSNGTARISISGQEVFNNLAQSTLSGSSYITVNLNEGMSCGTAEILLYTPLSDVFGVDIIPADETVLSASNIPFAYYYIAVALFAALAVSVILSFGFPSGNKLGLRFLPLAAELAVSAVFVLEYRVLNNTAHFLYNIKMFLWAIIPAVTLTELVIRLGQWSPKFETLLAVNVLYALCIVFLWENVFFFILLYSGVVLQAVNLIFALSVILKQTKPITDCYLSAHVVFWTVNLLSWLAVSVKIVAWHTTALLFAVFLYGLCAVSDGFIKKFSERAKTVPAESILSDGTAELHLSVRGHIRNENRAAPNKVAFEPKSVPIEAKTEFEISNHCLEALSAFNQRVINKVYDREKHSLNVSEYSRIISSYMGMSRKASDEISRAAALHDIGKICVPENVLFKSGRLSEAEFEEIKKHVIYGFKLLDSDESFFKMAALVAKEHHEHVDGSGYMGLKGKEISLPAKIVAVADVFDALVSERSYKEPWSFEQAFEYISEHVHDYFDKDVVEAFVSARTKIYEFYSADFISASSNSVEEGN